jgi:hypothetical protein
VDSESLACRETEWIFSWALILRLHDGFHVLMNYSMLVVENLSFLCELYLVDDLAVVGVLALRHGSPM